MAILDTIQKPYIADRNTEMFIGLDYPLHKSDGSEGYFKSTSTTIEAVKTNIKMLLMTEQGERLMQPTLGLKLRRYLFEQFTSELEIDIQNEIVETINHWLPFVEIQDIKVGTGQDYDIERNTITVKVDFNITRDPNTLESVQVQIGES